MIVVDEEHDASFKQHEGGFRYSARDLAVVRAQQAGVPIVLGSATPALETLHNVNNGRYTRLSLPRRAAQAVPPRVALVDLRANAVQGGISTPAVQAIERHLERRRPDPRIPESPRLRANTSVHGVRMGRALQGLRRAAHGASFGRPTALSSLRRGRAAPVTLPHCGFAVKPVGQGTERIEEVLAKIFPQAPLVRLDRDVVRKRGDMETAMARMHSGEARILVGTQMVTKGHHFPNVTLVIVHERGPGPVQHGLSRARAAGADHRAGGRPRRARRRNPAKC